MKAFAYLTACAGFVVACSATNTDDSASSGSAVHSEDGVCSTIDYHHTQSNADFYRHFETDAQAAAFMNALVANGQLGQAAGDGATLREISTDERINRLINEVYEGYKKAYPAETAGMPTAPKVAIVESDSLNAFAMGTQFTDDPSLPPRAPWIFVVLSPILTNNNTDNELRGLFAHEMGHLILRTFLPEIRAQVRTSYLVRGSEDGILGASQEDNAQLADHVEEIATRQLRVGGTPEIGMPAFLPPLYVDVIRQMATMARQRPAGATACANFGPTMNAYAQAEMALIPNLRGEDLAPRSPTALEKTHFAQLWADAQRAIRSCVGTLTADEQSGSLADLMAQVDDLPATATDPTDANHAALLAFMLDAEKQTDAQHPNATLLDRMLAAEGPIRADMAQIEAQPAFPIDSIRVYDFEEDADDASVRVLAAINQDPVGIGDLMLSFIPADVKEQCKADVAAHKPIGYGRFIDVHPAACWRYYHATQFAKALGQCAPGPRIRLPSKGGGRPSILDRRDGFGLKRLF